MRFLVGFDLGRDPFATFGRLGLQVEARVAQAQALRACSKNSG